MNNADSLTLRDLYNSNNLHPGQVFQNNHLRIYKISAVLHPKREDQEPVIMARFDGEQELAVFYLGAYSTDHLVSKKERYEFTKRNPPIPPSSL